MPTKTAKKTTVRCRYCGKECKPRGLHVHERVYCPERPDGDDQDEKTCPGGKHKWRLIRADMGAAFKQALQDGYTKWCKECDEVE